MNDLIKILAEQAGMKHPVMGEVRQILLRWDYVNGKPTPNRVEELFPASRYIKTVKRPMMDPTTLDNMIQTCVLVERAMG